MWKSVVGHDVSVSVETQGDDWDTDPDFVVSLGIALLAWKINKRWRWGNEGKASGPFCHLSGGLESGTEIVLIMELTGRTIWLS